MKLALARLRSDDQGTSGLLFANGKVLHSLELPDRHNQTFISCIPPGTYKCKLYKSQKFGQVYALEGVAGRSGILIHAGNWAGDRDQGYKCNSYGCILLGKRRGRDSSGQKAVWQSKAALRDLLKITKGMPFELVISEV